jgi:predicted homoserine dehydrogenase-like protein
VDDLPFVMRPREEGGHLHHKGQVEVVSSLESDGRAIPYDIRFGVWVVFEGDTEYIRRCFTEYGVRTDPTGRYACLYKRWHLIGLEVGISVARSACAASRPAAPPVSPTSLRPRSAISRPARCSTGGRLHGVRQAFPRRSRSSWADFRSASRTR